MDQDEENFKPEKEKEPIKLLPIPIQPPERLMNLMLRSMICLMDYMQVPILKMLKIFKPIGRLIGFGTPISKVVRLKEYLISLKDGAKLATDIYLPEKVFKERSKGPTLLVRLPYGKDLVKIVGYL